jgi:hypothetical protein
MRTTSPIDSEFSRRAALRKLALTASGAAALTTGIIPGWAIAAEGKMAQSAVGYQDSPQGAEDCANCSQFEPPAACKIVAGNISPGAWCKVYAKKST